MKDWHKLLKEVKTELITRSMYEEKVGEGKKEREMCVRRSRGNYFWLQAEFVYNLRIGSTVVFHFLSSTGSKCWEISRLVFERWGI